MENDAFALKPSPVLLRWFLWYCRGYIARHFHAVRVSRQHGCPSIPDGPILIVTNHASWWDPLIGMLIARHFSSRELYAPIEEAALKRYRILGRLGLFGVESGTARGARQFLRIGSSILERPQAMLAVTAQGKFCDPRERPVELRPGIGHLAAKLSHGLLIPMAVEYPFWVERLPEVLIAFGTAIPLGGTATPREWTQRAAHGLEQAQDSLAVESRRQDPDAFHTIMSGRRGIGGVYDFWKRLHARWTGVTFRPGHGTELLP